MNNKPVAWIDPYDLERLPHFDCHIGSQQLKNGIALYTHQYERPHNTVLVPCDKLAEMQAENEMLKAEIVAIEKNTDYWADKGNWIRNNKPVAWMYRIKDTDNRWELTWAKSMTEELYDTEPLYTHPADLTDEELYKLLEQYQGIELCKAVLRKASEK